MPRQNLNDLVLYQKCTELRREISVLVKQKLPKEEKYRLTDQLIRCSRSISANIAEGHGRFHFQENIQFCRVARGSLYELKDHLSVALEEDYIDKNDHELFINLISHCLKLINGYIKYIKELKNKS